MIKLFNKIHNKDGNKKAIESLENLCSKIIHEICNFLIYYFGSNMPGKKWVDMMLSCQGEENKLLLNFNDLNKMHAS